MDPWRRTSYSSTALLRTVELVEGHTAASGERIPRDGGRESLTSFADDVAATKRAIAVQDGPTVLVGTRTAELSSAKRATIRR